MSDGMVVYEPTDDEIMLATEWHGGQASMFYAIASTGRLSLGTQRPLTQVDDRRPSLGYRRMTDSEWKASLAYKLLREIRETMDLAHDHAADFECAEQWLPKVDELHDDLEAAAEVEVAALGDA